MTNQLIELNDINTSLSVLDLNFPLVACKANKPLTFTTSNSLKNIFNPILFLLAFHLIDSLTPLAYSPHFPQIECPKATEIHKPAYQDDELHCAVAPTRPLLHNPQLQEIHCCSTQYVLSGSSY